MPAVSFAHYLGITTLVHVRYFSVVPTYGLATSARPEIGRVSNSRARKWWEKSQMNLNYLVLIRDAKVGFWRARQPEWCHIPACHYCCRRVLFVKSMQVSFIGCLTSRGGPANTQHCTVLLSFIFLIFFGVQVVSDVI